MSIHNAVFILIGSNLNPRKHIIAAIKLLANELKIIKISRVFQSKSIRDTSSPDYLNCAILCDTISDYHSLKYGILRRIEGQLGRDRTKEPSSAICIDLDIILFSSDVIKSEDGLILVPDPKLLKYAHVLLPIIDLDPEYIHPLTTQSLKNHLSSVDTQDIRPLNLSLDHLIK